MNARGRERFNRLLAEFAAEVERMGPSSVAWLEVSTDHQGHLRAEALIRVQHKRDLTAGDVEADNPA